MGFALTPEATSWQNVEVTLGTGVQLSLPTIKKIEYGSKVNHVFVWGAGNKMYDITEGIIETDDVKIQIGVSDAAVLFNTLVLFAQVQPITIASGLIFNGQNGMDMIYSKGCQFNMAVSYQLVGNLVTFTDTMQGCRIKSWNQAPQQGPDPVMVDITMSCVDVQRIAI